MKETEYIITVKREHRGAMPDRWMDLVRELEGVEVLSADERFNMLRIKADKAVLNAIEEHFGDMLHVEERSEHETRK